MAFERKIAKYVDRLFPSTPFFYDYWIEFTADGKYGWAQPDCWKVFDDCVLVIESKLSQKPRSATGQLKRLYRPLLEFLYPGKTIIMVHAFKNKRWKEPTLPTLHDAFTKPEHVYENVLMYHHVH